ncbi:50S ribosomal protein L6 [Enterobacteriaceae endosymbiont of Donacia bicoloricornis]|uniref:50S ribosomal protein L6 n=1 Tax=Enterobacteriaceae endosymbiont of Donacia bicoloricornis TaxID=2675772 RepID=UPI00144915AD|nr:50S ribosomal protein L6 [Enterobacteriaceae endosymbiont of Donacia bicoloricornis]QJC37781.1 50S ribosomal protein L6 [Enterobacteriaceae endosymbiont of Donacia bicoloricornis]
MSRIAKKFIIIPSNIKININGQNINVKGNNGILENTFNKKIKIIFNKDKLLFKPKKNCKKSWAQAGTASSIMNSMIIGVTIGFSKKLILFGVGYKFSIKNNILNLILGFSHTINFSFPKGIFGKCLNQNEIILTGANKQLLGQVAAKIRSYRPPEPYKGKGIRYTNEIIKIKETKKK